MPIIAAVQIASESPRLTLSCSERAEISGDAANDGINVVWLPGLSNGRKAAGHHISTAIEIFLSGVAFAALVKPLYEGAAQEAGKDLWIAAKKLIARIWKKQTDAGYRNETEVKLVFELYDDHVALCLRLPTSQKGENDSYEELEVEVHRVLSEPQRDWQDIQSTITKLHVGVAGVTMSHGKKIHVIQRAGGKWTISPENSVEFYLELRDRTGDSPHGRF